jgi:FkbM family methyltransferase
MKLIRKISNRVFRSRFWRLVDQWRRLTVKVLPKSKLLIKDFDNDLKMYVNLTEHIGSQIFWFGYYDEVQLRVLEKFLKPQTVFVDVGANIGEFTIFAAKRVTQGRVITFEPVPFLFGELKANVEINKFKNVELINKALSDRSGVVPIFNERSQSFDDNIFTLAPGPNNRLVAQVETIRLDDYIGSKQINVMKIDVDGSELAVLKGGIETIQRCHPIIFIEVCEETSRAAGYEQAEILNFLDKLGYEFKVISSSGEIHPILSQELTSYQNVVCIPKA